LVRRIREEGQKKKGLKQKIERKGIIKRAGHVVVDGGCILSS
jgi:hypothetical protein